MILEWGSVFDGWMREASLGRQAGAFYNQGQFAALLGCRSMSNYQSPSRGKNTQIRSALLSKCGNTSRKHLNHSDDQDSVEIDFLRIGGKLSCDSIGRVFV